MYETYYEPTTEDLKDYSNHCQEEKTMERCFACNKPVKGAPKVVRVKEETTTVHVGPDCYRRIVQSGLSGYQPPLGGPVLVATETSPTHITLAVPRTLKSDGVDYTYYQSVCSCGWSGDYKANKLTAQEDECPNRPSLKDSDAYKEAERLINQKGHK